jgi:hypothetical protein
VHQPCTNTYTKPCIDTYTKPCIKHAPQLYQAMHQPCTKTFAKPCINHAPTPIPNRASTMHHNCAKWLNHQPCTSTPYQVSILYHTMYHMMCQPCTSTMYINNVNQHLYHTMYQQCISTIYHIIQSCHTPCAIGCLKQVPSMVYLNKVKTSPIYVSHTYVVIYQVYSSTMHLICASSMCQCLNNIPKTCFKHAP